MASAEADLVDFMCGPGTYVPGSPFTPLPRLRRCAVRELSSRFLHFVISLARVFSRSAPTFQKTKRGALDVRIPKNFLCCTHPGFDEAETWGTRRGCVFEEFSLLHTPRFR